MFFDFTHKLPNGVVLTYWAVNEIKALPFKAKVYCQVYGYLSKAEMLAGSTYVLEHNVEFTMDPTDTSVQTVFGMVLNKAHDAVVLSLTPPEPPPEEPPVEG